jgi:hypothetical protein
MLIVPLGVCFRCGTISSAKPLPQIELPFSSLFFFFFFFLSPRPLSSLSFAASPDAVLEAPGVPDWMMKPEIIRWKGELL